MQTLADLIHGSIGLLRSNAITQTTYARPYYPTCVVYFGKRSALYHGELLKDIARGWGGNADYIRFYTLDSPSSGEYSGAQDAGSIPPGEVKAQITELLSAQDVFADMTRLSLYCILDTTDISSASEFEEWYKAVEAVKATVGVSTLSMLMVILNESLQFTEISGDIKRSVLELYKSGSVGEQDSHIYDSVFIFSNRLKNGSFVKLEPTGSGYSGYNLFADMVLLTNTRGDDYGGRRARLYGSGKPALTAAYGSVQKPMYEIILIALGIVLEKLKELIPGQSVDAPALTSALGIQNGRSEAYERFHSQIKGLLPPDEFLEWLPGKAAQGLSFQERNRISDGCLQAFLEENHFRTVSSELLNRGDAVINEIRQLLSRSLNAAQLRDGIPPNVREAAYDKAEIAFTDPDKLPVSSAIDMKVKRAVAKGMREKTDEALDIVAAKAGDCMRCFGEICSELDRMYSIGEDGTRKNLTAFYGMRIHRYFSDGGRVKELFDRVFFIENGKEDMLNILLDTVVTLSGGDPVFRLSFSEELTERLRNVETERKAQEYIGQELIKNLNDKVSFYSKHVFQGRIYEAYFINTEGTGSNLLYRYLSDREIPPEVTRTFFNTCSNDIAESIWFYECSEDNLRL